MKICLLMWYDDNCKEYGDINFEINKSYCQKYGIEIIKCNERRFFDRHQSWECLTLILEHIENYDYVIWIDSDAFFYKNSRNIIDIIIENKDKDFIFSRERGVGGSLVNCGIFIVKNSKFSNDFLQNWAFNDNLYNEIYKVENSIWEQGAFCELYHKNFLNIKEKIALIDYGILQHFTNEDKNDYVLVRHCAGQSREERLKVSKEYSNL